MFLRPNSNVRSPRASVAAIGVGLLLLATRTLALPQDSEQPIHIHSDSAELDQEKNLAIYRGAVRMEQGTLTVTADTMTIELQDRLVVRITAVGDRAHYQQQFKADQSMVNADAKTIVYYTQEERVELTGDAYLTQDKNEFTGELINYNVREGKVDAQSNGQGKVQVILQPATLKKPQPQ